jgi:hypothetical protein
LKCDGTRAETRFSLSAKQASPFKSAGASVQSTTGSRGGRISGSNTGYTMFRGSVKRTGYPLHSTFSPSIPLPCVTVCHHISTGLYSESTELFKVNGSAGKQCPFGILQPTSRSVILRPAVHQRDGNCWCFGKFCTHSEKSVRAALMERRLASNLPLLC